MFNREERGILTNTENLDIAILKSKKTRKEIATTLGLSEMGFYKKAKGLTEFKASEISALKQTLNLTAEEMTNIFFA